MLLADFHLHSRFSRATSSELTLANLEKYAKIKGLGLLGTGDFTHPTWLAELKANLEEDGSGFPKSNSGFPFVLQTEVSNIYSQAGRLRRIHTVLLAPDFATVDQINETLARRGNLEADGRPIFGSYSCIQMVEELKAISDKIEIIPAHAWTPWFSVFGSMSGFDSLKECFGEKTGKIHAIETGMSSDPSMNWRLSALDNITLVSNSDSHSFWPWRIGREANLFDIRPDYGELIGAIRTRKGFVETVEVEPSYGKYHFDGHRACGVSLAPNETKKSKNLCPKCHKPLTIGVLHRVEELADRPEGFVPKGVVPFRTILPLSEILGMALGVKNLGSQKVWAAYNQLIGEFGNEWNVLTTAPEEKLAGLVAPQVAAAIMANREGKIKVVPGYDGVYGKPILDKKALRPPGQQKLEL